MAFEITTFKLDMTPGRIPAVVNVSQGDIGRTFVVDTYWNGKRWDAYGTPILRGKKPDGTVFEYNVDYNDDDYVEFSTTEQMTIIPGPVACELVFSQGGTTVATANFILKVEFAPYDPDAISESEVTGLTEMIQAATPEAVADWFENDAPTSTTFANAVNDATDAYLDENGVTVYFDEVKDAPATIASIDFETSPGYIDGNGSVASPGSATQEIHTNKLSTTAGISVAISIEWETANTRWVGAAYYDKDGFFVSRETLLNGGTQMHYTGSVTIPSGAAFVVFSWRTNGDTTQTKIYFNSSLYEYVLEHTAIDNTLSESGEAADAKVTGDALSAIAKGETYEFKTPLDNLRMGLIHNTGRNIENPGSSTNTAYYPYYVSGDFKLYFDDTTYKIILCKFDANKDPYGTITITDSPIVRGSLTEDFRTAPFIGIEIRNSDNSTLNVTTANGSGAYLVTKIIENFLVSKYPKARPQFVEETHAGIISTTIPENTLQAVYLTAVNGYGSVEFDVRKTSDNILVLWHDATFTGTDANNATQTLTISESTFSQLSALTLSTDAYFGEIKIAKLSDVLDIAYYYGMTANIHIKSSSASELVAEAVVDAGMSGRAYYNNDHDANHGLRYVETIKAVDAKAGFTFDYTTNDFEEVGGLDAFAELGADVYMLVRQDYMTAEKIREVRAHGFKLILYNIDAATVNLINSFRPDIVMWKQGTAENLKTYKNAYLSSITLPL